MSCHTVHRSDATFRQVADTSDHRCVLIAAFPGVYTGASTRVDLPTLALSPTLSSFWLPTALSALAALVVAAIVRTSVLHARIARRSRELELELALRRHMEDELEAIRDDLENRVRERTRALEARNAELTQLRLALETANQRLKRLVAIDALTGIANRRHFDRALDRELRRARREHLPLSLVFLDLDEFKRFNDTYGHARGDEVLKLVAHTLDETFRRGGDLVARYGGEEFAVVLPGVDGRRAELYAERLRRRIWRLAVPYEASHVSDRVTISGGVATAEAGATVSPDALLHAADKALYRAKCQGRNRIASGCVEPEHQRATSLASHGSHAA